MADSTTTLVKRIVSALIAGFIILAICYFGGDPGIYLVCTIAIVLAIREFSRMAFRKDLFPKSVTILFWAMSIAFYVGMADHYDLGFLWFALANIGFVTGTMWLTRNQVGNESLLPGLAMGTFGMFYCVLLPNFAMQLVKLEHGAQWFLFLLLVVFFGDTFAYFGGRTFGHRKFMPQISPSKTFEGSLSGMAGSVLAGCVHLKLVLPEIPIWQTALFCVICGFIAQSGDLLMSLVKRVAQIKDSGGLMPGHGGVLDRLDGVFIACPLVYAFALYIGS